MTYKYVHKYISFILLRTNAAVKCATWIFCSLRLMLSRCRKAHHVTSYLWISFGILVDDRDWVFPSINQTYFTSKNWWTTSFLPYWSLLRLYIKISQSNYVWYRKNIAIIPRTIVARSFVSLIVSVWFHGNSV